MPYPIEVTVYDIDGTLRSDVIVEIFNLNNNDKLTNPNISNGVYAFDRANATKEWENNETILIRASIVGQSYRFAEIRRTMTGGSMEQILYLQAANPVHENDTRKDQVHLSEHDPIHNAKKVITQNILETYMPAETDNNNSGFQYFGNLDRYGNWYIQRRTIGVQQSIRFIKGNNDFSGNWDKRTTLDYKYFNEVF